MSTLTIVFAAALGGLGTLGVQWVFGAHVAAHNKRVTRRYEYRDDLQSAMLTIGMAAARLTHDSWPSSLTDEERRALIGEDERAFDTLNAATAKLVDSLAEAAGTYAAPVQGIVMVYAATVRAVTISMRTRREKAQIIVDCTQPLLEYLFGSFRHPFRKWLGLATAVTVLKKHGNEVPTEPAWLMRRLAQAVQSTAKTSGPNAA